MYEAPQTEVLAHLFKLGNYHCHQWNASSKNKKYIQFYQNLITWKFSGLQMTTVRVFWPGMQHHVGQLRRCPKGPYLACADTWIAMVFMIKGTNSATTLWMFSLYSYKQTTRFPCFYMLLQVLPQQNYVGQHRHYRGRHVSRPVQTLHTDAPSYVSSAVKAAAKAQETYLVH